MTDAEHQQRCEELDERERVSTHLIATKIMGWKVHFRNTAHWMNASDDWVEYRPVAWVSEWRPLRNVEHALQVMQAMVAKGNVVLLKGDGLRNGLAGVPGWTVVVNNMPRFDAETPEKVLFLAALAVCELLVSVERTRDA